MQRRQWLKQLLGLAIAPVSPLDAARGDPEALEGPVRSLTASAEQSAHADEKVAKIEKPKSEWRKLLTPEAYSVLFEEETERAFTSPLDKEKRAGSYLCAACYLPLFTSKAKFESGTGWPSFFEPIKGRLGTKRDFKLILPRTEYHCLRCGGHQGHVFNDGPPPTGQRWCNNGVALKFVPEGESLPPLRT